MIVPVWKKVGESTHVLATTVARDLGVITAHTGTLDPLAEGVIIILTGDDRYKKYEYATWQKTYTFDLAFGISTDSFDGLGLLTYANLESKKIEARALTAVLANFKGSYTQTVPPYAAVKIKGKPLHWYARNNKLDEVDLPTRSGEIFAIKLLALSEIPLEKLVTDVCAKVSLTKGDLRQAEILARWQSLLSNPQAKKMVQIAKITVTTSKGLYVRVLAQDICAQLTTVGFVSRLIRTKNGEYTKASCKRS